MPATRRLIARAAAALERRELESAERDCREVLASAPNNADALHILGLVRRRAGDRDGAEPLLRASVELAPERAEFRVNLSNLLSSTGRLREAEQALREALAVEPGSRIARLALARVLGTAADYSRAETEARSLLQGNAKDAEAWAVLATAQRGQGKLAEAEASYRTALSLQPSYAAARHNLGALLGQLARAEESLAELDSAAQLGVVSPELQFNRARALMELGRFIEADAALVSAVTQQPEAVDAQIMLAKLRYMRGDDGYARDLAVAAAGSSNVALTLALGDLLRRAGDLQAAHDVLCGVAERHSGVAQIQSSLAVVLQELGRLDVALERARVASAARPDDADITENLVAILLQSGEPDEALPLIGRERARAPLDGRWLAYEATAARLAGHSRYAELYDYDRFVRSFELQPPAEYGTIAEFNAELAARLDARHTLQARPLDQSLRHGTQTSRSLLREQDPVIRAFLKSLSDPLSTYCRAIGFSERHPFVSRNRGSTELVGCWSVRLRRDGYHVNHIHPQGWISSAYYVAVPAEATDAATKCGWIKFGEPRMPTPGLTPALFMEPRVGRLILFPSYMWHGTVPILGDEPRLTIAFDAVPRPA